MTNWNGSLLKTHYETLARILDNIVSIIWSCISTTSMRLLWNGETLQEFTPTRGISQGDSISLSLCDVYWTSLSVDIYDGGSRSLETIWLSRHGPLFPHLAFMDVLILFVEASVVQVCSIQNILNLFCRSSSQKISLEKSRMFFSTHVVINMRHKLSQKMGIQWTEGLGKYLGVPLLKET